ESAAAAGWVVELDGLTVQTRTRTAKGYGALVRADLSRKELEEILGLLIDNDAGNLPEKLFAATDIDFSVGVLNREKTVQGRAGVAKSEQARFEGVVGRLQQVHARALERGNRVPSPG